MDRNTWAAQTRMIECLRLQPKIVFAKDSHDSKPSPQPSKQHFLQQGHVLHTDGRRAFCLRCGQDWNEAGLAADKYEDIPCPGITAMWRASLLGPWQILGPQVHIGNKPTHRTRTNYGQFPKSENNSDQPLAGFLFLI